MGHPVLATGDLAGSGWWARTSRSAIPANGLMFHLMLLYMFLEYARPQDSIPYLAALHLPALVTVFLAMSLALTRHHMPVDKQTWVFIVFLGLMLFHVPIARNNHYAFHLAKGMLITFVVYLALVTSVVTLKRFETLTTVWLATHAYLAINGIMKHGRGIGGFLLDENDFGMTLNVIIPLALFLGLSRTTGHKRIIYIALTALFLLANLYTLSRGGFVGLAAVMLYCWLRSPRKMASALLVCALLICVLTFAPRNYWAEMQSITDEGASAGTGEQRVYMWRVGWQMFLDNPIIGVGQGNFPFWFRTYEVGAGFEEGLRGRSLAGHEAHSVYVTLAAEHGIIGIAILSMMLYYFRKDAIAIRQLAIDDVRESREQRGQQILHWSWAMGGGLVGFLVSGVFISVLYYPSLWLLIGFNVALKNAALDPGDRDDVRPRRLHPNRMEISSSRPVATWR
jgi:O-antigen ligase